LSENADFIQNKAKFGEKAQFTGVNEHFEPNFNAVLAERCVFGQPPSIQSLLNKEKSSPIEPLDIEILLAHCLNKNRTFLHTWPETQLNPAQLKQFNDLMSQKKQGIPLAYILGYREFWSLEFAVTQHVLIPRHETELLIEMTLELFEKANDAISMVDLGTGSGVIAISIAHERPQFNITATDVSIDALQIAKQNAQQLTSTHINFIQSHWFDALKNQQFNLVISNPPYIEPEDVHLEQGDLRFEPAIALSPKDHGLSAITHIIDHAKEHLYAGGYLILEHGYDQQKSIINLLNQAGYSNIKAYQDLAKVDRAISAQWL
jgi:release factor glutamine methyltransferase